MKDDKFAKNNVYFSSIESSFISTFGLFLQPIHYMLFYF
jgi:hypothetical protein